MKTCTKCHIEKEESSFRRRSDRPDRFNGSCKKCELIAKINWKRRNGVRPKESLSPWTTTGRICSKCKVDKSLSEFGRCHAPSHKGYQSVCRKCLNSIKRVGRKRRPKPPKEKKIITHKICKACLIEKPVNEFKKWKGLCMICQRQQESKYRLENHELIKKQRRESARRNPETWKKWQHNNRELVNKRAKEYYLENIEKCRVRTRAKCRQYRSELRDCYIRGKLIQKFRIDKNDIEPELIDLSRNIIKIKRELCNKQLQLM